MSIPVPRTCMTCAHRCGSFETGVCAVSGVWLTTTRQSQTDCGKDFEAWRPRQGTLIRILQVLLGVV
jgi:hypothetical protein